MQVPILIEFERPSSTKMAIVRHFEMNIKCKLKSDTQMKEWMKEWMNERMNERMNEWINEWINKWMNEEDACKNARYNAWNR